MMKNARPATLHDVEVLLGIRDVVSPSQDFQGSQRG